MFHSTSSSVFKSPRSHHMLTQWKQCSIIVAEIVTVVLSNKILQRKQSSQFWISGMQTTNGKHEWTDSIKVAKGLLRFFKLCKNQIFETN